MGKTDYELAMNHRYVTQHGRKPAPGVTSIDIIDKPQLQWGASFLAARDSIIFAGQREAIISQHREALGGKPVRTLDHEDLLLDDYEKVVPSLATDDEIWADWLRGRFRATWDLKAERGSIVHDIALGWAMGEDVDVPDDVKGYVDALEMMIIDTKLEFLEAEFVVVHPNPLGRDDLEFGGRGDFVGIMHAGPHPGLRLGDYKTGRCYRAPIALQSAGLMASEGFAEYDQFGRLTGTRPHYDYDGGVIVYLHADASYELIDPYEEIGQQASTQAFFDLRSALNFKRSIESIERRRAK